MKFTKVVLQTGDIAGTKYFYKQVLGLQIVHESEASVAFQLGFSVLQFEKVTGINPTYHFAFLIPSNKVNESLAWAKNTLEVLPYDQYGQVADFKNWNAHAFYFHDNQQNILEFIAHHDLNNNINNPFSIKELIGICEIGLVVEDVTEACDAIKENYGVPYYAKGPNLPNFSVMGDEVGLFIVSAIDRGWLPTQAPAKKHSVTVIFEWNAQTHEFKLK